ncbi:hypothetical protein HDV63DRAFT_376987 [Trichoderma sp. SZMC 28014]
MSGSFEYNHLLINNAHIRSIDYVDDEAIRGLSSPGAGKQTHMPVGGLTGREEAPLSCARDEGDEARLRGYLLFLSALFRKMLRVV